jgi:hypothetical protein
MDESKTPPTHLVPLSNFVRRGFGFVHHSIAVLYHEVPNPNLTIRNFFIAVRCWDDARTACDVRLCRSRCVCES